MAVTRKQEQSSPRTSLVGGLVKGDQREKRGGIRAPSASRKATSTIATLNAPITGEGNRRASNVQVVIEKPNLNRDLSSYDSKVQRISPRVNPEFPPHEASADESSTAMSVEQPLPKPILLVEETQDTGTTLIDPSADLQAQSILSLNSETKNRVYAGGSEHTTPGTMTHGLNTEYTLAADKKHSTRVNKKRKNRSEEEPRPSSSKQMRRPASHKRFESEEPQDTISQSTGSLPLGTQHDELLKKTSDDEAEHGFKSDSESGDDAPEEVTAAVGKQQSKASIANANKAILKEAEKQKAKRRIRDRELKEQATSSKKSKARHPLDDSEAHSETEDDQTSEDPDKSLAELLLHAGPLPETLPEEILAVESETKPRALHLQIVQTRHEPNKRKQLEKETQPLRDLKHGSTRVRVLPKPNTSLPPAAVAQTANIKEQWLTKRAKEQRMNTAGYRMNGAGARRFLVKRS